MVKSFTQTSSISYDRHRYKFVYSDGSYKIFDHYEDIQLEWFQISLDRLGIIEVLDKKKKTKHSKVLDK